MQHDAVRIKAFYLLAQATLNWWPVFIPPLTLPKNVVYCGMKKDTKWILMIVFFSAFVSGVWNELLKHSDIFIWCGSIGLVLLIVFGIVWHKSLFSPELTSTTDKDIYNVNDMD